MPLRLTRSDPTTVQFQLRRDSTQQLRSKSKELKLNSNVMRILILLSINIRNVFIIPKKEHKKYILYTFIQSP